ncbi:basic leucine zipper transcriptional factor ATF-like 2 [Sminthopsis crassicaudata]|uniref:basic leucine zipper transcriptional factor ATF-like 2 n=1 Tax=Sminthopsis crassicaudata TaxID=9301 RepID=UPI003D69C24F
MGFLRPPSHFWPCSDLAGGDGSPKSLLHRPLQAFPLRALPISPQAPRSPPPALGRPLWQTAALPGSLVNLGKSSHVGAAWDSEQPQDFRETETGLGGGVVSRDFHVRFLEPPGTWRLQGAPRHSPGLPLGNQTMHLCGGVPPCKEANLLLATDPREADRQLKRRERNRVAAQRSRHKHTEKADGLHQEHEWLEKANQVLRKEIRSLQAEVKGWLRTLEEHQRVCLLTEVPGSAQTPPERAPPMGQRPPPAQAPASPSAGPPPAPAVQAPPPPGFFSHGSLSSPLPPLAALTQAHGPPSLPASSSGLGPLPPAGSLLLRCPETSERA